MNDQTRPGWLLRVLGHMLFGRVLCIYGCIALTVIALLLLSMSSKLDELTWETSSLSQQVGQIEKVTGANTLQELGGGVPVYIAGCNMKDGVPVEVKNLPLWVSQW